MSEAPGRQPGSERGGERVTGSFVIPCFREEGTVGRTLVAIDALAAEKAAVAWEIVIIDDGSDDDTSGEALRASAQIATPVRILRHRKNAGLGAAMRTGFAASTGDVVVAVDCDLSYSTADIGRLIDTWLASHPHIVIASPYMEGGSTVRVPRPLEVRSRGANAILSLASYHDVKTLTGMVRAYDGPFIRAMSLKAEGADVMVEIIYKAQILRARIEEIPATLSWAGTKADVGTRLLLGALPRHGAGRALDLGCGSGLIATLLARAGFDSVATDASAAACASTTATASANEVAVRVIESDAGDALDGSFDLIACNPPFHPRRRRQGLLPRVRHDRCRGPAASGGRRTRPRLQRPPALPADPQPGGRADPRRRPQPRFHRHYVDTPRLSPSGTWAPSHPHALSASLTQPEPDEPQAQLAPSRATHHARQVGN